MLAGENWFYRAEVTAGACEPFYSEISQVDKDAVFVDKTAQTIRFESEDPNVDGIEMLIPENAISENSFIKMQSEKMPEEIVKDGFTAATELIVLETGFSSSDSAISLIVPVSVDQENEVAMAFSYDHETGGLSPIVSGFSANDSITLLVDFNRNRLKSTSNVSYKSNFVVIKKAKEVLNRSKISINWFYSSIFELGK